jgi:hypothetical protein
LESFLTKIESRIDKLTKQTYYIDSDGPPVRKQLKTTPSREEQEAQMDIEPNRIINPHAGTTQEEAGEKN